VRVRTRWIIVAALVATGFVWVGQGLGLLRGSSFMVDDPRWAVAGVALLLTGAVLGWSAIRSRRRV
jgi:hypothetical protein